MNKIRSLKAFACATAMAAAGGTALAQEGKKEQAASPPAPVVLPRPATDLGVFVVNNCPISQKGGGQEGLLAVLGGILLPLAKSIIQPAVEAGVDFVARKLDERALELNASATARSNGLFFEEKIVNETPGVGQGFGCIIVTRAKFGTSSPQWASLLSKAQNAKGWSEQDLKKINDKLLSLAEKDDPFKKNVQLAEVPEFYAEFPLEVVMTNAALVDNPEPKPEAKPAEGKNPKERKPQQAQPTVTGRTLRIPTNFSLRPELVDYRLRGTKRGDGAKQIVIDLSIDAEIVTAEGETKKTIFAHTYDIGPMNPGERKNLPQYSAPLAAAPSPAIVTKPFVSKSASGALESRTVAHTHLVPFVVTATVKEIEKGGDFEKAIADSLRANKDKIVAPVLTLTEEQLKKAFGIKEEEPAKK